jgi:hypothetical protein
LKTAATAGTKDVSFQLDLAQSKEAGFTDSSFGPGPNKVRTGHSSKNVVAGVVIAAGVLVSAIVAFIVLRRKSSSRRNVAALKETNNCEGVTYSGEAEGDINYMAHYWECESCNSNSPDSGHGLMVTEMGVLVQAMIVPKEG